MLESYFRQFDEEHPLQVRTDENGEYSLYLVPGQYAVREYDTEEAEHT